MGPLVGDSITNLDIYRVSKCYFAPSCHPKNISQLHHFSEEAAINNSFVLSCSPPVGNWTGGGHRKVQFTVLPFCGF